MLERVLQEIRTRHRFVVTSHARPDGDGIGSALACGQILRVMGKDAEIVMHDGVPRIYQNLPFADRVIQADGVPADFPGDGAVILLECDSVRRTLLDGLEECFLINIDHHASGRNFAHVNWIDSTVMATAELVYRLARLACVPVDRDIATCLYTALMTDTGSFMFEGTNEHTFTVARELVLAGAIMHQERVGIAAHAECQRLAGPDRNHMNFQAAGGPEQRNDVTKQAGVLGRGGRAERDETVFKTVLGVNRARPEEFDGRATTRFISYGVHAGEREQGRGDGRPGRVAGGFR